MFIKVRPKKISLRLGSCAKLAPRYCGPFEILSRIGQVVYQLALPPNLRVHNVFHISVLNKYVHDDIGDIYHHTHSFGQIGLVKPLS